MRLTALLTTKRGKNLFLPAHGRGNALPMEIKALLKNKPGLWDLPELPDIGGLGLSEGAIEIIQQECASSIGAKKGWFGVNGATGLLQASLLAIAKPKENVLMPRNIHRSVIHACILGDINPVLFDLPYLEDRGHYKPADVDWFQDVLNALEKENIVISAVVLTNPTYQGYSVNLRPLITLIHNKNLPVVVDEAHGAYFSSCLDSDLPQSALKAGADLVVHSLHKSANGLVQTAALWWQGSMVDPYIVQRCIHLFQTSSPSALLLASCEAALNELRSEYALEKLKIAILKARFINDRLRKLGVPLLDNQDPLKLILHTAAQGISGIDADPWFINRGLVGELPEPGTITFCLGFARHQGIVRSIKNNWDKLISSGLPMDSYPPFEKPPNPFVKALSSSSLSAFRGDSEIVPLSKSVGRISADLISPYPPGIPLLFPGEILTSELVEWMLIQKKIWPQQISSQIRVVN
ncbi:MULTISPECIES: aminotransferase class I/II-fold pyridoxal phosphate-dependent enzyme [unclassified Prochlorococcus]|uniref:aminotransferase class I/II-fold pyridoxal phosphate-dependent enzyme n=1 Tax=unclassified Prochlorococcus TaxID=2627481 RepID=UPI0005337377|nr:MULTISPECIES: aminotransferase class I/II-fold pyridoxal phosphate-dependent enzyme [unclassified Prochlorococcus]KGG15437.1 Lysine decarboxylase [Prochlorococcus sp. MIT 0602]KGG17716.1 Lysine decarboxylase [Prochlorococcus sp. MIT 0603]